MYNTFKNAHSSEYDEKGPYHMAPHTGSYDLDPVGALSHTSPVLYLSY